MGPPYRAFTVGVVAAMTMFAFEGIGVASAMPVVARALDGLPLYAWAFNGYIVTSLVAMVVAGEWCDRSGPRPSVMLGITLFAVGAAAAGASWSMLVLVGARAVQGFGMGLAIVALYVVIGRAYPERLRPRVFGVLSAAWVLPAIIGPLVAGFLTDHLSWRAVFWSVVPFVLLPALLLVPRLGGFGGTQEDGGRRRGRVRLALVAAAGLALLQEAGTRRGSAGAVLVAVGLALLLPALRLLLPHGALRFARGLPTVGWAAGSQVQGRMYARLPRGRLVELGALLVGVGLATATLSLLPALPFWVIVASWLVGAAGMGMAFGSIGSLVLELSAPEDQGANVASLQVCDSVGSVVFVGIAGAIYAAALARDAVTATTFVTIWLTMACVALAGAVLASRIRVRPA